MSTTTAASPAAERPGHRRNKSSSVLKSIMTSKNYKRSPSDGTLLSVKDSENGRPYDPRAAMKAMPMLPPDHPHTQQRALSQMENPSSNPLSPHKSKDTKDTRPKGLHKKTLSSVSLRSLGKDKEKESKLKEPSKARADKVATDKPNKIKPSTNLAVVFQKSKASKEGNVSSRAPKDKENTTPPSSAVTEAHTPIWAQFSSQAFQEFRTTSTVPLNDRRDIEQEIALYTPTEYSPSKQRNFFDYGQPSLQKRQPAKERPKSTILPSTASASSFLDTISRKISNDRTPLSVTMGNEARMRDDCNGKGVTTRSMLRRASSESRKPKEEQGNKGLTIAKKGARVMAAVAAINGKGKGVHAEVQDKLDPEILDAEFEEVLESRNIPQHQRAQMRTLKLEIKADFVRMHKVDAPQSAKETTSKRFPWAETTGKRSTLGRSNKSRDDSQEGIATELAGTSNSASSSKRSRPRSRTFTFSKGDSPTKKHKTDGSAASYKSLDIPKSPSSTSLGGSQGSSFFFKAPKAATPDEFVTYMRKVQKPQIVEVGKLHKLRLLLRNETVEWVDTFIGQGGMTELVGLLHRIMEVEWREEHEDTLLHEVLRCLKGLCTTDLALKELCNIAPKLFPGLLSMLFDEEHKGPSEFTTRDLIMSLLFAHLSSASPTDLSSRVQSILSFVKDPVKEKDSQAIPFILEMQQPRPYRVWCREINNVTKEVFWIFIHHLTVIPMPPSSDNIFSDTETTSYKKAYFPGPRPPVPAAPYVGGVEWEATNYIATHLDLLNGLIASLPTKADRNSLRTEFRASGFEKLLGHLRACNAKYYGAVHDGLKTWVAASVADGWDVKVVRMGGDGKAPGSPIKSPIKSPKKAEQAPRIEAPKMDLGLGLDMGSEFKEGKRDERAFDDWI
ncbi:GTPase binding protein-like protein Rid1 [Lepidopterella palustris CBS 459.81]|uniref:GTPase binding protein-like protein Rid1 n=1 Tax=Lepidopterella palustris CBS 459.81 TaxID=1314670 RepID=A0A8E2EK43_9PEZI|nr:GTPase binding protein-like protein Rid1 [Lepidopterella palustris CBS 459.81]